MPFAEIVLIFLKLACFDGRLHLALDHSVFAHSNGEKIMDKQQLLEALAQAPLFSDLSVRALEEVLLAASAQTLKKNQVFIQQGDQTGSVFLLIKGSAKITAVDVDGNETLLNLTETGQTIGELSAIDGEPRSASATMMTEGTALQWSRTTFDRLAEANPLILKKLLKTLSQVIRDSNERANEIQVMELKQRLIKTLRRLARIFGHSLASTDDKHSTSICLCNNALF